MKIKKGCLIAGIILMILFLVLNGLLLVYDRQPIGPENSVVGFASVNAAFHDFIGTRPEWYDVTELLGYIAIAIGSCFAVLGLCQWIHRRSFFKVDTDLYILGCLYIIIGVIYAFYTFVAVNYRPVLSSEGLEPSFPSSHTVLSFVVLGSVIMQIKNRIGTEWIRSFLTGMCIALLAVIIIGRVISGVHWLTDIAGALLISSSLLCFYRYAINRLCKKVKM